MSTAPPVQMLEMFTAMLSPEPPSTTTIVALAAKRPLQIESDVEKGPTTTLTATEVVPTLTAPIGIVYVSAASI